MNLLCKLVDSDILLFDTEIVQSFNDYDIDILFPDMKMEGEYFISLLYTELINLTNQLIKLYNSLNYKSGIFKKMRYFINTSVYQHTFNLNVGIKPFIINKLMLKFIYKNIIDTNKYLLKYNITDTYNVYHNFKKHLFRHLYIGYKDEILAIKTFNLHSKNAMLIENIISYLLPINIGLSLLFDVLNVKVDV